MDKKIRILPTILLSVNFILFTFIFLVVLLLNYKFEKIFQEMLEGNIPTMTRIILNQTTIMILYLVVILAVLGNRFFKYSEKIRTVVSGGLFVSSFLFFIFYIYCLFNPLIELIHKLGSKS